ncbi:MAG: amidohydrolase family protein [Bryobacteraceae bacterium]
MSKIARIAMAASFAAVLPAQTAHFDTILRHGVILDGTGLEPYRSDVGIVKGHISRIGNLSRSRATLDLDVTNLYVAPGFINIHSHAVRAALATAENMLTQGVTTEIVNPDGGGSIDIATQLAKLSSAGLAVNLGAYIGFDSIWEKVMESANRRPSPGDVVRMRTLLTLNLERGAWGVSGGLDYEPASLVRAEDVIQVLSAASPWRTNFPNHDRLSAENNYSSRAGIEETIRIGESAALVPVITHMKVQGREQGSAAYVLSLMRQATARGRYTAADVYPYLAGHTSLTALLVPGWAQEGGRDDMLRRFHSPAFRPRIAREIEDAMQARFGGPQGVFVLRARQELTQIMNDLGVSAGEAVIRTLEQEGSNAILRFGLESDLIQLLQNPTTSIACDCGATRDVPAHPRSYGSFPRVLGHYVRETKALTWEDAVRKMTALPAATIGMVDRGLLMPGMAADITVFDPATIIDHATYEKPAQVSEGIRHVLVNGQLALRDGKATGARAGRTLLRTAHMPSRPMNVDTARRISVKRILKVTQDGGARRAKGSFRFDDPKSQSAIRATDLGFLQTTSGWASFTAWALDRPITVIIDKSTVIVE